jgi:hypothetical protein
MGVSPFKELKQRAVEGFPKIGKPFLFGSTKKNSRLKTKLKI